MNYDVIIIGAGPGGIFAAYELMKKKPECKIAVFEEGYPLEKRNVQLTEIRSRAVSIVSAARSCADLEEPEHFRMENTTLRMTSVELCSSISERNRQ